MTMPYSLVYGYDADRRLTSVDVQGLYESPAGGLTPSTP